MVSLTLKQIEELVLKLPTDERRALIERLAVSLSQHQRKASPKDLYGDWRDLFPKDFDIDNALREIRNQWRGSEAA